MKFIWKVSFDMPLTGVARLPSINKNNSQGCVLRLFCDQKSQVSRLEYWVCPKKASASCLCHESVSLFWKVSFAPLLQLLLSAKQFSRLIGFDDVGENKNCEFLCEPPSTKLSPNYSLENDAGNASVAYGCDVKLWNLSKQVLFGVIWFEILLCHH